MASSIAMPALSDEGLGELLETISAADSVELKLTIPVVDRVRTGELLGVDPVDGQIRQVFFFDTPTSRSMRGGSSFAAAACRGAVTTPS